jgi:predicted ATPase
MQIAKRVYSLAQEHHDSAVMIGTCRVLACTFYFLGDFEVAQQYAMHGVQIWRSGAVQPSVEEVMSPAVVCIVFRALSQWHFGEIASSQATLAEGISLAKELNDMYGLGHSLLFAGLLGHFEHNPAEVERVASDLIELSIHQNFASYLAGGEVLRGWARCALGDTAEGISWILDGMDDWRATGSMLLMPYLLALKAEALHLADRTSEALEAINEAEAIIERREERWWRAEVHRLRGVFLTAVGAQGTEIEAVFRAAIRIAKEQKSVSLEKRAEVTRAEYRRQKASASAGRGIRLPLW